MTERSDVSPRSIDEGLLADPEFPWPDGNPYALLNEQLRKSNQPTLGPMSSAADVNKASFTLQGAGRKVWEKLRPHWDRLRMLRTRVGIDFLHYPIADIEIGALEQALWEVPMPVAIPDLMGIAECRVELGDPSTAPSEIAIRESSISELVDFTVAELLPSLLCTELPSLSELIEADNDEP